MARYNQIGNDSQFQDAQRFVRKPFSVVSKYADHESDRFLLVYDLEFDMLYRVFFYLP